MSPWPRPFMLGMPAPRWRSCLPDWMPAGILISCACLSRPGTSIVAAERGGGEADRAAREQGRALALEDRVPGEVDEDVEIARRAAAHPGLAFAGEADAGALVDPGGDVDRQRLALVDPALAPAGRAGIGDHLADAAACAGRSARPRRSRCARAPGRGRRRSVQVRGRRARLGARAVAGLAARGGIDLELDLAAVKGVLELDFEIVAQVRAAPDIAARRPCWAPPMNSPKILSKMSAKEPKSCAPPPPLPPIPPLRKAAWPKRS